MNITEVKSFFKKCVTLKQLNNDLILAVKLTEEDNYITDIAISTKGYRNIILLSANIDNSQDRDWYYLHVNDMSLEELTESICKAYKGKKEFPKFPLRIDIENNTLYKYNDIISNNIIIKVVDKLNVAMSTHYDNINLMNDEHQFSGPVSTIMKNIIEHTGDLCINGFMMLHQKKNVLPIALHDVYFDNDKTYVIDNDIFKYYLDNCSDGKKTYYYTHAHNYIILKDKNVYYVAKGKATEKTDVADLFDIDDSVVDKKVNIEEVQDIKPDILLGLVIDKQEFIVPKIGQVDKNIFQKYNIYYNNKYSVYVNILGYYLIIPISSAI